MNYIKEHSMPTNIFCSCNNMNGIEKIIEVKLDDQEKELLATSAKAVKSVMTVLDDMKMF